ncbi:hypothetical protein CC86DRAFT_403568 [Ophiobolus disseminans]|uniref:Uncharacterized protein n=1 Tax=Ophiobolus disseminans TaxID=1469910 RepID=A0A6A7AC21_9PLEO|nr:hypothetical protein CC86DRAFT_403568 [Ophiobolus disseminans]
MLRRFATAASSERKIDKKKRKKSTGNERVNVVNLAQDLPEITTELVKKTFGQQDMYKDNSKFDVKDQMRMEKKLSDIEREASRIIARAIIDAPVDPKDDWAINLTKSIYPPDAIWLFINARSMYLAFVTPSDPGQEFILTGNAYGIHEGSISYSVNEFISKETETSYTEFHLLTVISPRLAMILRHNSMPEPLEDMDRDICSQKATMLAEQAQTHLDPEHATSLLYDLPIAKARNSYTVV